MTEVILLTGISGFIAKHIALCALNRGHVVKGTLRSPDRAEEVRAALRPHLKDPAALDRLSFAATDLERDDGWDAAMQGMTAVIHCASPFPLVQPRDEGALIRPAVDGTLRVLRAAKAAGVARVILTSSAVAVVNNGKDALQDENDWCDLSLPGTTAYARSKTLAEKAAWEFAKANGLKLTTINPGMVAGPPLDDHYGASLDLLVRILKGRDPLMPPVGFPFVDVRDVAEMHLRALDRRETAGKRYIAAAGSITLAGIGQLFKAAWPTRKIATREAPRVAMRLLGLFDPSVRSILPKLGRLERVSNLRAVQELGMTFIPVNQALKASADWLVRAGKIWA
ncbi:aldehyde reductase [Rhodobacter sp. Har01]|uniref:SDR family oxidoreductase n=1 Tax=Rhodobacter sp. Har01 TaxID=2883999 RepID=UPI001D080DA0|nr:aldehyde reductase [Rhodobacter sp. Har01]MCB6177654.1 aldehyde reductase [Rhodobacter sp. Har01]